MSETTVIRGRKTPSYRKHKSSGQAVVTLPDGRGSRRDILLGDYGTQASHDKYDQVVSEWLAAGRRLGPPEAAGSDLTVSEMIAAIVPLIDRHYRRADGTPTTELEDFKSSLTPLKESYGATSAKDFGPLRLKAMRERMIKDDLSLGVINQRIGRIRRAFRWAVEQQLVAPAIYDALVAVADLPKGRGFARETKRIRAVNIMHVDAIHGHVLPEVWTMIQVQLLCGCRPGEICAIRPCDIEMMGPIWWYRPPQHKTAWRGHEREIALGPRAQAALKPFLPMCTREHVFSPKRAIEAKRDRMRAGRKTKVQPSQICRKKSRPQRKLGDFYTARSYSKAVAAGCRKADAKLRAAAIADAMQADQKPPDDDVIFCPSWHPHQLRHLRANEIRREYGYESTATVLGDKVKMVEVYSEADRARAAKIAAECG